MNQELLQKQKLPEGWKWSNLKKISLNPEEGLLDGNWVLSSDMTNKKEVRLIQLADIGINKFLDVSERYVTKDRAKELHARWVESGDILIARMPDPIGRACIVPDLGSPLITAVDVSILKIDNTLADKLYITYYLNSQIFMNKALSLSSGSTRKRVSRKKLELISILLPPLLVQQQIVSKLDAQMAQIEIMKKEAEKEKKASEIILDSFLKSMIDIKDTTKEDILDRLVYVKGGKRLPAGHRLTNKETDHPYIRVVDFRNQTINESDLQYLEDDTYEYIKNYIINKDDIYLSIAGSIGFTGTIPEHLNGANLTENAVRLIIKDNNIISKEYLSFFLNSELGQTQIRTRINQVGQPKLAIERLKTIKVKYPLKIEQKEIVEKIKLFMKQERIIHFSINQKLSAISQFPSSILNDVFGKYEIPEVN